MQDQEDDSPDTGNPSLGGIDWAGIDGVIGAQEPLAALIQQASQELQSKQESATENASKLTESAADEAKAQSDAAQSKDDSVDPLGAYFDKLAGKKEAETEDSGDENDQSSKDDSGEENSDESDSNSAEKAAPLLPEPPPTELPAEPSAPEVNPQISQALTNEMQMGQGANAPPPQLPVTPNTPPVQQAPQNQTSSPQQAILPSYAAYQHNPTAYTQQLAKWAATQPPSETEPDWTEPYPPNPAMIGKKDAAGDVYDEQQYISDVRFWLSRHAK